MGEPRALRKLRRLRQQQLDLMTKLEVQAKADHDKYANEDGQCYDWEANLHQSSEYLCADDYAERLTRRIIAAEGDLSAMQLMG